MILKIYQNSSKLESFKEQNRTIIKNKEYRIETLYGANIRDLKILNKAI